MIQYRRIAATIVGMWLGASVFADFAVTRNFATVDPFLRSPGTSGIANEIERIGSDRLRPILRRNAGEENNTIFEAWESAELAIAAVLIGSLFLGGRPTTSLLSLVGLMLAIVAVQRFYLSPQVTALGRQIADLSPGDPLNQRFWTFHGIYSGSEIAKLLLGIATAVYLSTRRKKEMEPTAAKEAQLVANMNG